MCSGKFFKYIKSTFGINRLPYNIKLIDLINSDESKYDLYVELPEDYFNEWCNYPYSGVVNNTEAKKSTGAMYYDIEVVSTQHETLKDLLHPYETSLVEDFVNKFRSRPSKQLVIKTHNNGRDYRPCEFYLSYWRSYILLDTINNCKFIEKYLGEEQGKAYFESEFKRLNDYWVKKYSSTFARLATYRSFVSRLAFSESELQCTYKDISSFILRHVGSTVEDLESDMALLLELHSQWESRSKSSEITSYSAGLKELRKDIYFMFEWLCYSGLTEREVFEKWSSDSRQFKGGSDLAEVLDFEEFKLRDSFYRYVPIYIKSKNDSWNMEGVELKTLYYELEQLNSFYPWVRSFYDLHESINNKDSIHLVQPRVIDFLLTFTIRTEVLIRDLVHHKYSYEEYSFKDVLSYLSKEIESDVDRDILRLVTDKNNFNMTLLGDKPEDIFEKIDKCKVGKNWSKDKKDTFSQLLKFIASRNYFAHHSYKDEELNLHVNELPRLVLKSCLFSALYLTSLSNMNGSDSCISLVQNSGTKQKMNL